MTFQIIRERGLVYVSCKGHVTMTESQKAFRAYLAHPDFREGQAHLIDTADALSYGEDVGSSAQFELQARLAEAMPKGPEDLVLAYYAPTQIGQKMARAALQAWQGIPFARVLVGETEAQILDMLGFPERRFADLTDLPERADARDTR
ncbi:hypothetical protein [Roseivivax sp. THAF40]|uniref:hypothetical protein n=1 Tax=Roseivivax sp. THAF40 TaxID=2587858 RepID=UPI001268C524|nr:hypothetical protein [Roseivivax sp. THAF40]